MSNSSRLKKGFVPLIFLMKSTNSTQKYTLFTGRPMNWLILKSSYTVCPISGITVLQRALEAGCSSSLVSWILHSCAVSDAQSRQDCQQLRDCLFLSIRLNIVYTAFFKMHQHPISTAKRRWTIYSGVSLIDYITTPAIQTSWVCMIYLQLNVKFYVYV